MRVYNLCASKSVNFQSTTIWYYNKLLLCSGQCKQSHTLITMAKDYKEIRRKQPLLIYWMEINEDIVLNFKRFGVFFSISLSIFFRFLAPFLTQKDMQTNRVSFKQSIEWKERCDINFDNWIENATIDRTRTKSKVYRCLLEVSNISIF